MVHDQIFHCDKTLCDKTIRSAHEKIHSELQNYKIATIYCHFSFEIQLLGIKFTQKSISMDS